MLDMIKLELPAFQCKDSKFYDLLFAETLKGQSCLPSESKAEPGLGWYKLTIPLSPVAISLSACTSFSAGQAAGDPQRGRYHNDCCVCGEDVGGGRRSGRQSQVWDDLIVAGTETDGVCGYQKPCGDLQPLPVIQRVISG